MTMAMVTMGTRMNMVVMMLMSMVMVHTMVRMS